MLGHNLPVKNKRVSSTIIKGYFLSLRIPLTRLNGENLMSYQRTSIYIYSITDDEILNNLKSTNKSKTVHERFIVRQKGKRQKVSSQEAQNHIFGEKIEESNQ